MIYERDGDMKKIFEAEFTLEETITSGTITTIASIDTGLKEGDLEIGEVLIAEIRMLENLDTDNVTDYRQLDRFEFLSIGASYYCTACYTGGNPTFGHNPSTDVYNEFTSAANGVFIYYAGKYLSTLTISGRNNGSPKPIAGRYQLLLYKTGFNYKKDYRE